MELIDLSQKLQHGSLSYPGIMSGLEVQRLNMDIEGITLSSLSTLDPHCGTHIDAPLHFVPGADDAASSPLQLPVVVLVETSLNPIPPSVLDGLEVLRGRAVLFSTGWERRAGTKDYYTGFPSFSQALASALVRRDVACVGIDAPSVDPADGGYFAHRILLSAGIPIIEGLANLKTLSTSLRKGRTVRLAAFPLPIQGIEGSPVRAVAIVD